MRHRVSGMVGSIVCIAVAYMPIAVSHTPEEPGKQGHAPLTLHECEGANNCGTWTLQGTKGEGRWPSGEVAALTIENWDTETITIRRVDSAGPSAGLTAVYHGSRNGNRIEGQFRAVVPGKSSTIGMWEATLVLPAQGAASEPSSISMSGTTAPVCVWWFHALVCPR